MKKIFAVILSFVLALTAAAGMLAASAEGETVSDVPTITVGTATAKPGQTVTLPVVMANNPGIFSFTLGANYDTTRLNLTGATINVEGLGGSQTVGQRFVWLGDDGNSTFNGTILYLTFEILADAPEGDASVAIFYTEGNMCNYNEEDVDFELVAGGVTVSAADAPEHTHTEGDEVVENNVDPGCETDGSYDKVVRCTVCGEELSRETVTVPATDHELSVAYTVHPTCTEEGYTLYFCLLCDAEFYLNQVSATGHTVGAAVEEGGYYVTRCNDCGEELSREAVSEDVTTAPESGSEFRTEADTEVETEHNFGEWTVIVASTCTTAGSRERVCLDCGAVQCEEEEIRGHNIVGTVTDPTCTEDGVREGTCSVCGETVSEVVPATGHSYGDWVVVTEATATTEGYRVRVCAICQDAQGEAIPKVSADDGNDSALGGSKLPGCRSTVSAVGVWTVTVAATAIVILRKKKEN